MKVLIVEDELLIRMDLEQRLRKLGAIVVGGTATGEEAVEIATQQKPDAVFMDIKLRGPMNGIEAAKKILALHKCRMIFISAFQELDIDELTATYSADIRYASKPLATTQLQLALGA